MSAALYHQWSKPIELYAFDDSLMYYRYAYNIVEDGVYGWNHEPSNGCTSTLYTFITAGTLALSNAIDVDIRPEKLVGGQSLFFYILYVSLMIYAFRRYGTYWWDYMGLMLIASLPLMLRNAFNGMETSLAMLLLLVHFIMLNRILSHKTDEHWRWSAALALLIYLNYSVRPESLLFHFVVYAGLLFESLRGKEKSGLFIRAGVITVLLLVADSILRYQYFGYVFALPVYVKTAGFYTGDVIMGQFRSSFFLYISLLCFSPYIFLQLSQSKGMRSHIFTAALIIIGIYLTSVVQIMGMAARFYIPYLGLLPLAVIYGRYLRKEEPYRVRNAMVAFIVVFVGVAGVKVYDYGIYLSNRENEKKLISAYGLLPSEGASGLIENKYILIGMELASLDDSLVIASGEHGAIAAYNLDKRVIDYMGLHNRKIAFGANILETVVSEEPDLVQMPHTTNLSLRKEFIDYFERSLDYDYIPGKLLFGVALRRDLNNFEEIKQKVESFRI